MFHPPPRTPQRIALIARAGPRKKLGLTLWRAAKRLALAFLIGLGAHTLAVGSSHARLAKARNATGHPDHVVLFALAQHGQGQRAVERLAAAAWDLSGWGPAPGDSALFDDRLPHHVRASTLAIDDPPAECADPKLARFIAECKLDLGRNQPYLRFGPWTFASPDALGQPVPRSQPDDLLATYIEEVGHSWQEYLYETAGLGHGRRTRRTSWETGLRRAHGWEYQAKIYVLSLNGTYLALSDDEQARLRHDICTEDGYANPTGAPLPPYGPPPGWPNPPGWPLNSPDPETLQAFCLPS